MITSSFKKKIIYLTIIVFNHLVDIIHHHGILYVRINYISFNSCSVFQNLCHSDTSLDAYAWRRYHSDLVQPDCREIIERVPCLEENHPYVIESQNLLTNIRENGSIGEPSDYCRSLGTDEVSENIVAKRVSLIVYYQ